ncbi:MAG TPA: FHA domain-containing protein [Vicinamibacteria bacterium]|nr:FHA domain-containing protein [Vicinamibacteria bacterium]
MRVEFGEFALDARTRELRGEDRPVHLSPKAFQLLELLVRRRPEAVPKAELIAEVWPGVHVTEASLASTVAELRAALGDQKSSPRFIRTLHGFGYAFCAEAVESARPRRGSPDSPAFRLLWNRREIQLGEGENLLGRDRESVVWLDSSTVSRRHARITIAGGRAVIEDLGSRNGTWVGGRRAEAPTPLADGDEVKLGSVLMTFRVFEALETESD